jgi:3-methyl-2-oxobutanoate hydroxymethyltransferase
MYAAPLEGASAPKKLTAPDLSARKGGAPISMVTAYDATMARLLEAGGAEVLLVGDSLGMVVQGHSTTLPVTLDEVAYHGRAVSRVTRFAHVVADLPFMSFQLSAQQALESAGRLLKEGACESVKLEGGAEYAEHVRALVRAGIPVMGHLGLLPQSVHALGGFKVQGKGDEAGQRLLADAVALEEAGAYALVLEAIPPDVAAAVTSKVSIPTIGIGAGPDCDGQVLVCYDLLGLTPDLRPKFAKRYAELGEAVIGATRSYVDEVRARTFPAPEHCFKPNGPLPRPR